MFAVDHVLVSDAVLDAPFSCNLGACRGGCCVQGDSGAPLEPDERRRLEEVLPVIRTDLRPDALDVIAERGPWEETEPGRYATTCVGDAECVFVTYEGPVALCALHKAYRDGRIDWPKPISCHLYPLRVESYGDVEAINYEPIDLCNAAERQGGRLNEQLAEFLREPLVRRYGSDWYERFLETCRERRTVLRAAVGT